MFCSKCGAEIQPDTVFCGKCGNRISTTGVASESSGSSGLTNPLSGIRNAIPTLLVYLAIAAAVFGFLYAILGTVKAYTAADLFYGLLLTVFPAGFLIGISELILLYRKKD
jgi:uncharacterized membrane protein YvbJ